MEFMLSTTVPVASFALAAGGNNSLIKPMGINNSPVKITTTPVEVTSSDVTSKVEVTLRRNEVYGYEWIDIIVPKEHEDICQAKITEVCNECQNLWRYGYRSSKEECKEKEARGVKPENTDFRIHITYTTGRKSGLPPEKAGFNIDWQCGLFHNTLFTVQIRDPETGKLVGTTKMKIIYKICHSCAERLANELRDKLTQLVTDSKHKK